MKTLAAMLVVLVSCIAACAGGAPPRASSPPSGSVTPGPTPSASAEPAAGIYLRVWQTQALPPPATFMFAPLATVSNGVWIDNNIAIPAIFPGPLLVLPNARSISVAGEQAIVDQARELGLLEGQTDLAGGGPMPGGVVGHVRLVVDGTRYELTGDPARTRFCDGRLCPVDPGTPEAFAAFHSLIQDTSWLEPTMGPSVQYRPARLAVLVGEPAADNSGIAPNIRQVASRDAVRDVWCARRGRRGNAMRSRRR